MKEKTNCLNCGSPLHYDETNYGSIAKCQYCGTEYHIDKLGRVEEYKVKIKMQGKIISFYVNTMTYEMNNDFNCYRDFLGRQCVARIPTQPTITLELTSYDIEEAK